MSDDPNLVSAQFGSGRTSARPLRRVPFRIVVLGDFGLSSERLHGFDEQEPDEALAAAAPHLDLAVADRLTGADRPLGLTLAFRALRDFTPSRLIEAVPDLSRALAVRDRLRKGMPAEEAFADMPALADHGAPPDKTTPSREAPAPAPPPSEPSVAPRPAADDEDPLDRLFDMVDSGTAGPPPAAPSNATDNAASRAVSAFIGSMGGRRSATSPGEAAATAAARVERRIADQVADILDTPEFRSLETAWQGLRFLLRRCDRRAQCFVHAVSAPRDEAVAAARALLVDNADRQPAGIGLIVAAYDYGSGPGEIARLQELAELAEEIQVPAVASSTPDFLHGETDLARRLDPETLLQDAAYGPWNSLRAKPAARWLGVTVNRFRLRDGHDLGDARRFAFENGTVAGTPLEAGGAWLVAALAAESAAESGWPSDMTGADRAIDGLPLYGDPETDSNLFAVSQPLRPDAAASLANAGLIALVGQANRDIARVVRVASVHSRRADPSGDLPREGTFDYQLLVSRLIRQIEGNADLIFATGTPEGIRDAMDAFLRSLLGASAQIRVTLDTDDRGERVLTLDIVTGHSLLDGASVHLDLPV